MNGVSTDRWRCLTTGCNPRLTEATAQDHKAETGHRVARWPVRSAEGQRRARRRNKTGYYDKYNVGAKSAAARGIRDRTYPDQGSLPGAFADNGRGDD